MGLWLIFKSENFSHLIDNPSVPILFKIIELVALVLLRRDIDSHSQSCVCVCTCMRACLRASVSMCTCSCIYLGRGKWRTFICHFEINNKLLLLTWMHPGHSVTLTMHKWTQQTLALKDRQETTTYEVCGGNVWHNERIGEVKIDTEWKTTQCSSEEKFKRSKKWGSDPSENSPVTF